MRLLLPAALAIVAVALTFLRGWLRGRELRARINAPLAVVLPFQRKQDRIEFRSNRGA